MEENIRKSSGYIGSYVREKRKRIMKDGRKGLWR